MLLSCLSIYQTVLIESGQPMRRLVSADWLRKWVEADENEPVDQSALLCEHGQLKPSLGKGLLYLTAVLGTSGWRLVVTGIINFARKVLCLCPVRYSSKCQD